MFVDARTFPSETALDADICIVGAGPAGVTIARELFGSGARVVILESGGIEPAISRKHLDRGRSVGYQYHNLMFTRARAFGGTSNRWHIQERADEGWMAAPLDPIDFEARSEVPWSGWPFSRAHMEPYYERAAPVADLNATSFSVEHWERPDMQRLPLPEDRVVTGIIKRGMTTFARFRDEFASYPDVTVVHHATVVDLVSSGEPPAVSHVVAATDRQTRITVTARLFVLAGGGIENTRMLLASTGQQPVGLGNTNDLVGRFFMEHLAGRVGLARPVDVSLVRRSGLYHSHPEDSLYIEAVLKLNEGIIRSEGLLNAAFFFLPRTEDFVVEGVRSIKALGVGLYRRPWVGGTRRHLLNLAEGVAPITRTAVRRLRATANEPTVFAVRVQAEQAPNPSSRITLGHDRDRYGVRRPVLDWRVSDEDLSSIRRSEDLVDAELASAGLARIERKLGEEAPAVVFEGLHHHMGTTRMHVDPKQGVVDADSRLHGVRNVYVTGTSVFTTGGYINPTLTVVALAIRLADHLKAALQET
jgi:choline dehydrogenase-like flavoprotein